APRLLHRNWCELRIRPSPSVGGRREVADDEDLRSSRDTQVALYRDLAAPCTRKPETFRQWVGLDPGTPHDSPRRDATAVGKRDPVGVDFDDLRLEPDFDAALLQLAQRFAL